MHDRIAREEEFILFEVDLGLLILKGVNYHIQTYIESRIYLSIVGGPELPDNVVVNEWRISSDHGLVELVEDPRVTRFEIAVQLFMCFVILLVHLLFLEFQQFEYRRNVLQLAQSI